MTVLRDSDHFQVFMSSVDMKIGTLTKFKKFNLGDLKPCQHLTCQALTSFMSSVDMKSQVLTCQHLTCQELFSNNVDQAHQASGHLQTRYLGLIISNCYNSWSTYNEI